MNDPDFARKFTVTPDPIEASLETLSRARQRVRTLSRYACRQLDRDPGLLDAATLAAPWPAERMRAQLEAEAPADEKALARALRRLRVGVMVNTLARDLAGLATLEEVTATMTALAETTIAFALARLDGWLAESHGAPQSAAGARLRLIVVGMGKLGGGELNVSSDIDLVLRLPARTAKPPDRGACQPRILHPARAQADQRARRRSRPTVSCSASTCGCGRTARAGRWW